MTPPLTHEEWRRKMCCCCGGKAGRRKVTEDLCMKIRKFAQTSWNPDVASFPIEICETCRKLLSDCEHTRKNDEEVSEQSKFKDLHILKDLGNRGRKQLKHLCGVAWMVGSQVWHSDWHCVTEFGVQFT